MKEFTYNNRPQRLSKILAEFYPLLSYNAVMRLIKDKEVRVDGVKVADDVVVESGSVVRCYAKDETLKPVYEDDNLLVVYKPKGLVSEGENSAESIVKATEGKAILCHRLDTNTDGLLMFAKSQRVADEIENAFKKGCVEKIYDAHVYGRISADTVYRDYLKKNAEEGKVKVFSEKVPGSAEITTAVKVIGYEGESTHITVSIESGKTHQIRAHLAFHGHFVLGDGKYGRDDINRKFNLKKQQLSAKKLQFSLPNTSFLYYLNNKKIEIDN